jgi:hypothetical protein
MNLLMAFIFALSFTLSPMLGHAQKFSPEVLEFKGPQQTAEYVFRNTPKDVLISVQLFGSVARPGLYYVPDDTDLMKLLTLSGGTLNSTELEEVIVRKGDQKAWNSLQFSSIEKRNESTYQVDVDKLLRDETAVKPLKMNHQDFVYVPQKAPWISNDMSRVITLGSVILSAVLTSYYIQGQRER